MIGYMENKNNLKKYNFLRNYKIIKQNKWVFILVEIKFKEKISLKIKNREIYLLGVFYNTVISFWQVW